MIRTHDDEIYIQQLHNYVNLETLLCEGVDGVNDDFANEAIRQGGFKTSLIFSLTITGMGL